MGVILVFIVTVFLTTMIKCLKFFLKIEKNKKSSVLLQYVNHVNFIIFSLMIVIILLIYEQN